MKKTLFILLLGSITLSFQAGEKRTNDDDGVEYRQMIAKRVFIAKEDFIDGMEYSSTNEAAAAAPNDETSNENKLEDEFIKSMEDFLSGNVSNTARVEQILQQYPFLIKTLGQKRKLRTWFSELNQPVLHQIIGHKLVDHTTQKVYPVDIPLMQALVNHGLDFKDYPNLLQELNEKMHISPELESFFIDNEAPMPFYRIVKALGLHKDSPTGVKVLTNYISTVKQEEPTANLIRIAMIALKCDIESKIIADLILRNKSMINQALEIKGQKGYLLHEAIRQAYCCRSDQKKRAIAINNIRLLMAYGADPHLKSSACNNNNMDALSWARLLGDKETIDIVTNYGIQPLSL